MTPPPTSSRPRSVLLALAWVAAGAAFHLLYAVLSAYEVGKIGARGDIGGGLLPLAGYALILVGVARLVNVLRSRR